MRFLRFMAALAWCAPMAFAQMALAQPAPKTDKAEEKAEDAVPFAASGVVRDEAGKPIVNAAFVAPNFVSVHSPNAPRTMSVVAQSDAQGRFTLTSQIPGKVVEGMRQALAKNGGDLSFPVFFVLVHAPGHAVTQLLLQNGDKNELRLARGASANGFLRDDKGKPLAGLTVRASLVRSTSESTPPTIHEEVRRFITLDILPKDSAVERAFKATTDADGRWTIPDLPQGAFVSVQLDDAKYTGQDVSVTVGKPFPEPDKAKPATIIARIGARVSGRVLYPDGKPVVGANVSALTISADGGWSDVQTGADGTFEMLGVRAGVGQIQIGLASNEWATTILENVTFGEGATVRVPDITLSRGVLATGRVLETDSKAPIPDVEVHGGNTSAKTNAKGEYQIRLPAGRTQIQVHDTPPDFVRSWNPITTTVSETRRTLPDLFLRRALTLEGVARDEGGRPVPDVEIALSNGYGSEAKTDANGKWTMRGLNPNSRDEILRARVVAKGEWDVVGTVRVTLGAPLSLTLRRLALQDVTVRVVTAKGEPVPNSDIAYKLFDSEARNSWSNQTALGNEKGEVVLRGLRPEQRAEISATKPGFVLQMAGIVAPSNDLSAKAQALRASDVVMLPLNAQISGRALNARGEPIANARIAPLSFGDLRALPDTSVFSDAQGRFTLTGLPEAEVTIGVAHERDFATLTAPAKVAPANASADVTLVAAPPQPSERDVEGAFTLLERWIADARAKGLTPGEGRAYVLSALAVRLAPHDPERATRLMSRNGQVVDWFVAQAAIKIARVNPKLALEWGRPRVQALSQPYRVGTTLELATLTAKIDPQGARDAYEGIAVNVSPTDFSAESAERYAQLAALAGALNNPDSEAWTQALLACVGAMSRETANDNVGNYAVTLSDGGAKTLRAFLKGLSPVLRVQAIYRAMQTLAWRDVKLAQSLMKEAEELAAHPDYPADPPRNDNNYQFTTNDMLAEARDNLARVLLKSDPKAALALLKQRDGGIMYPDAQVEAELQLALQGDADARATVLASARAHSEHNGALSARVALLLNPDGGGEADWLAARQALSAAAPDNWSDRVAAYAFYLSRRDPAHARLLLENEWLLVRQASEAERAKKKGHDYDTISRFVRVVRAMIPLSVARASEMLPEMDFADVEGNYSDSARRQIIEWLLASNAQRRAMLFDLPETSDISAVD